MASETKKLSPKRREALRAIAECSGSFHKSTAEALERAGLAFPIPAHFNMLIGCNCRFASDWRLTEAGAKAIGLTLTSAA